MPQGKLTIPGKTGANELNTSREGESEQEQLAYNDATLPQAVTNLPLKWCFWHVSLPTDLTTPSLAQMSRVQLAGPDSIQAYVDHGKRKV